MKKEAYLHFGGAFTQEPNGPFMTIQVEIQEKISARQKRGLYGSKIATQYMIKYAGKWYRVYCCTYSNAFYIMRKNKPIAKVDIY